MLIFTGMLLLIFVGIIIKVFGDTYYEMWKCQKLIEDIEKENKEEEE